MPADKKRPYLKLSAELGDGVSWSIHPFELEAERSQLADMLDDWYTEFGEVEGESFTIEVVWMTDAEVEALPCM